MKSKKYNPIKIIYKIKWIIYRRYLFKCGKRSRMAEGFILNGVHYISLGENVDCARNTELSVWKINDDDKVKLFIEDNVKMAPGCIISCVNKIIVGEGSLLGSNVFITDNFHGSSKIDEIDIPPNERKLYSKGPVIIGKNVWIGRNVCIMPDTTIGDGAVIGANSVVSHDVPPHTIVGGVPARYIREIQ